MQIKHCKQELQIPEHKSFILFTYLAGASVISRLAFCKLGDFQCVSRFFLYQVSVVIYGICVLLLPFVKTFNSLVIIFVVFGLMDGGAVGQFSLLVLGCVGQRKVNQGWGYAMFSVGFGVGTGPPLAGKNHFTISPNVSDHVILYRSLHVPLWAKLNNKELEEFSKVIMGMQSETQ